MRLVDFRIYLAQLFSRNPVVTTALASFLSLVLPQLSVFAGISTTLEAWRRTEEIYGQLVARRRQERDWALERGKTIQDLACP